MKKTILIAIFIYFFFFSVFLFIQSSADNFISSDDPYYHARHSQLVAESGKLTIVEPWVRFHFLSSAPADPYFLYHLIASGFISLFGIIGGMKILSALLGAAIFPIFYLILKHYRISRPWAWIALLFFSSTTFIFRLALERAFVLSIALLPLSFYLIVKKRYVWLFLLSVFYILFYNLAPLVIFLALLFILADIYYRQPINLKPLIASAGGILAGLILHPQTINYLHVIYIHFIKIISLKLQSIPLPSGAEIQLLPSSYFLKNNLIIASCSLLAAGLYVAAKYYQKNKDKTFLILFIMTIFWFLVAFLVARGTEYWLPFGWIFIALVFKSFTQSTDWGEMKIFLQKKIHLPITLFFIVSIFLLVAFFNTIKFADMIIWHNIKDDLAYYQAANEFLIANTEKGSLVFYPNWSMFPKMFFFNTHNKYTAAFDPVFLYDYDPGIYWLWYNISMNAEYCVAKPPCITDWSPNKNVSKIKSTLKNVFGADTIIIKKGYSLKLNALLSENSNEFAKIYENKELVIYKIN